MSPRPDFFIVGAPKCGTTALFRYLGTHPGVFTPQRKEPHYFSPDLGQWGGTVASLAEYEALFSSARPQELAGEASVFYLYSKVAIANIMARNPAARIIVMLRNPVEAARSLHAFQLQHEQEDVADFEQAWRLQRLRLDGQRLPPRWPHPHHMQYGALYCYAPQVRRVLAQVPREQCLFLLFEEFFADPSREFARVLEFLGLPPDPNRTAFPVENPTMGVRSGLLARLLRHPPPVLRLLRRVAHALSLHPGRQLQRLNQVGGRKPALRDAFRGELEQYFSGDVAELEQLLGRALWPSLPPATQHGLATDPQRAP
ncbi:MAG: sulfotransferase [Proteobacteria bacterium]|nr:sulfotransferase [Pseudomonadota bacterium]